MANVKQLQINNTPYDIKDNVARTGLTDLIDILSEVKHAGAYVADGGAKLSLSIPLTETESTSVATAFSAIVPEFEGVTELKSGMMVCIKNTKVTSAAASATPKCWTLNIKKSAEDTGFGAKPVYVTTAAATYSTTHFTKDYKMLFIYDEDLNSGNGGWYIGQIFNSNTTYTNVALGQGYGTCTTAASTAAKVVTLSGYALTVNGIVVVKFDNDVPANATMNINSKGAKAIYEGDAPITAGVIKAGDIAVFIYNTYYRLIGINRVGGGVQADWNETNTGSAAYVQNKPTLKSFYPETTTVPNITSVGSASTWNFAMGTGNDEHTLIISGGNGAAPTLGAAKEVATGRLIGFGGAIEKVELYTPTFIGGGSND